VPLLDHLDGDLEQVLDDLVDILAVEANLCVLRRFDLFNGKSERVDPKSRHDDFSESTNIPRRIKPPSPFLP
jgi:hypothetical protein